MNCKLKMNELSLELLKIFEKIDIKEYKNIYQIK